jgi:peptidoglycan/xylan/chitin deacetylase (PgdA/CDA1 family)
MNIRSAVRRELRNVLSYLQIKFRVLPRVFTSGNDCILVYHGIDAYNSSDFNWRFIHYNNFRDHILFLRNYFKIVPLRTLFGDSDNVESRIAITFDDGYKNWITLLLPVLEKYQIPATLCITWCEHGDQMLWTDQYDIYRRYYSNDLTIADRVFRKSGGIYVSPENGQSLSTFLKEGGYDNIAAFKHQAKIEKAILEKHSLYWELLNSRDIALLSKSAFVEIAAHGTTHASLNHISPNQAREELKVSKTRLEEFTQEEVLTLAYPSGYYSRELVQLAEVVGFRYQLAEDYQHAQDRADPRIVNRVGVYNSGNKSRQLVDVLEKMK